MKKRFYRIMSHIFGGRTGRKYSEKYHKLKDKETGPIKRRYYRMMSHVFGGRTGRKYSEKYHTLRNRTKKVETITQVRTEVRTEIKNQIIRYDSSAKEILLVDTDSIGDYILFRNFLRFIKQSKKYHDYKITLLGTTTYKNFAEYLDSDIIDNFIFVPDRPQNLSDSALEELIKKLHNEQGLKYFYDTIIFNSFNSMPKRGAHEKIIKNIIHNHRSIFVAYRVPSRNTNDLLGYDSVVIGDGDLFEFDLNKYFFEQILDIDINLTTPFIEKNKVAIDMPWIKQQKKEYVVINPCGYDAYRMWHKNNWAEIIRYIKNEKKLDIVLCCSSSEREYCEELLKKSGVQGTVFAGLPVHQLLQVLKLAKLYIGQDSGIFHVAAALNTRSLCLSAGNAYFRFMNYPKNRPHIKILFPSGVEQWILDNMHEKPGDVRNVNCFYINEIRIPDVKKEIDSLLEIKTVIFIHRNRTENTGDLTICPYDYYKDYFDNYAVQVYDNEDMDYLKFKQAVFIIGGGGFIDQNNNWNTWMNNLAKTGNPVIGWGIGHNKHKDGKETKIAKLNEKDFTLLGIRDFNTKSIYLPCVSCFLPLLQNTYESKREIGCIFHYENSDNSFTEPTIYNDAPLTEIIKFIGESDIIITNTYHVMYWSTLMNKKVILYKPFSNRFDNFKYKPVVYSGNLSKDIKKAKSYPNAFEECTKANEDFFKKVKKIIENAN